MEPHSTARATGTAAPSAGADGAEESALPAWWGDSAGVLTAPPDDEPGTPEPVAPGTGKPLRIGPLPPMPGARVSGSGGRRAAPVVAVLVVGIVLAGVAGMFLLRGGDGGTATPAADPAVVDPAVADPPVVDPPVADPPAVQESPDQIGDAQSSDPLASSGGAAAVPAPPADGASEALRSHETAQEAAGWLMSLYAENQTFDFPAPMLSSYAPGYTWKQGLDATSDGPLEVAYVGDANTVTLAVAEGDGRCIFGRNRPDPGWEWQTAVTDECSPANMDEPADPA